MNLLNGVRVVDLSSDIAGPYCTKLLTDAGADVVKVETASGDPLRSWTASGVDLAGKDGALFQFLNAGKRSVIGDLHSPEVGDLLAGADLVIEDGQLTADDLRWLSSSYPSLSVISITPFGRTGPWSDRPWTEFILQALCGSIASRGTLDREPFYAGGRLGEWIGGTFAAVASLAALRGGPTSGNRGVRRPRHFRVHVHFHGGVSGPRGKSGGNRWRHGSTPYHRTAFH